MSKRALPVQERFEAKIIKGGGCWLWRGAHLTNGYCAFSVKLADGRWRHTTAHRVAYELYVGKIPAGFWIDHLCRNHGCVNPSHLEAVTPKVNTSRGQSPSTVLRRLGICGQGHQMTEANTYERPSGKRECRQCVRARDNARTGSEARKAHYRAVYQRRKAAKGVVS